MKTKKKPKKLPKPVRAWAVLPNKRIHPHWIYMHKSSAMQSAVACDDKSNVIPVEIRPLRKRKGVRRG